MDPRQASIKRAIKYTGIFSIFLAVLFLIGWGGDVAILPGSSRRLPELLLNIVINSGIIGGFLTFGIKLLRSSDNQQAKKYIGAFSIYLGLLYLFGWGGAAIIYQGSSRYFVINIVLIGGLIGFGLMLLRNRRKQE